MSSIADVATNTVLGSNVPGKVPASPRKELKQEDFMKLLLTQLKYQSPVKPYDSSEMLQQMSQMTTLTATQSLEKTIQQLNASLADSQIAQASQLVGRSVQIPSDVSLLEKNGTLSGSVMTRQAMDAITINIKDATGQIVKSIELTGVAAGMHNFSWDGKNGSGDMLPPGMYHISAAGRQHGKSVGLETSAITKVNSIALDRANNKIMLHTDGLQPMEMSRVIKIL